jgi:hypothetical protein
LGESIKAVFSGFRKKSSMGISGAFCSADGLQDTKATATINKKISFFILRFF